MKNLPTKKNELAVNRQAMSEPLAAMRRTLAPEVPAKDERTLHMLCSATGRPFAVNFTRANANEKFRIENIDAGNSPAGMESKPLWEKPDLKPQSFPIGEFDFAGFGCPHCGHQGRTGIANFFSCGCGKLQCGGRIRVVDNIAYATCHPGCGSTGPLGYPMESLSGEKGGKTESHKALKAPEGLKRLPWLERK